MQEELRGPVAVGVRKLRSTSWVIWRRGLGKSPDDWTTSLTLRVKAYYRRVGELGVSDGGMFKCSGDHSESWEEHSE